MHWLQSFHTTFQIRIVQIVSYTLFLFFFIVKLVKLIEYFVNSIGKIENWKTKQASLVKES